MGLLDTLISEANKNRPAEEQITRLHTGARVLETEAQAKYNDTRKAERNYTCGKGRALKTLNDYLNE